MLVMKNEEGEKKVIQDLVVDTHILIFLWSIESDAMSQIAPQGSHLTIANT